MIAKRKTKKRTYKAKANKSRTAKAKKRTVKARPFRFSFKGFLKAFNLKF